MLISSDCCAIRASSLHLSIYIYISLYDDRSAAYIRVGNFLLRALLCRARPRPSRRWTTPGTCNANSQQVAFKIRTYCQSVGAVARQFRLFSFPFILLRSPGTSPLPGNPVKSPSILDWFGLFRQELVRDFPFARPQDYPRWNSLWIHSGVLRGLNQASTAMTIFWLSWQLVIINEIKLVSRWMWMESNVGLVGCIYFWVSRRHLLYSCTSLNFYTRSLIRFRLYSSQLRSVSLANAN